MAPLEVLIAGAGVSGPAVAYWLKRAIDCSITVVERAPAPRTSGQAVDIRGAAVDITRAMGLEELIREKTTTEEGVYFVDAKGRPVATFPASGDTGQQSFTSELEILRGDLAKIFYDATKNSATFVFDESVAAIENVEGKRVRVKFANHLPESEYDLVVASDGMISKTRRFVFGKGPNDGDYLKHLGQYGSYFSIPKIDFGDHWARWHNATKGRVVFLRPDQYGNTRVLLFVSDSNMSRFEPYHKVYKEGVEAKKKLMEEEFKGVEWQIDKCIAGMHSSDDFYFEPTAQVKMDAFVKGRFALSGDAAWAPSPISGMGTASAIIGAYVLAGEISKLPEDLPKALQNYQSVMKPFMETVQRTFPGAPQIANPQTKLGIWILNHVVKAAAVALRYASTFKRSPAFSKGAWKPPSYPSLRDHIS